MKGTFCLEISVIINRAINNQRNTDARISLYKSLRTQSKSEKTGTRKTPNIVTFHTVQQLNFHQSITAWNVFLSEDFWSVFSRIRTEYGDLISKSPYSVWIRENAGQKNSKYRHVLGSALENVINKYKPISDQQFVSISLLTH